MRSILTLILAVALLAVIVLDGSGMVVAYQSSRSGAQTASHQAAIEYVSSGGNLASARQAATSYARTKGLEIVGVELKGTGQGRWFEVTVRARADTYVLKFIPVLSDFLVQEATATAQF